jgi:PEP-CTERM motif
LKLRIASLLFLTACLAAVPSAAQTLYSNGPVNGTTDAWTINFGFVVSDTFTLSAAAPVTGVNFYAWTFPGDILETAEVSITSSEFGGTTYTDQILNFTQSACSANQFGFNVCLESSNGMTPTDLSQGTYWLNLSNAVVNDGDPIYWDENSGPSLASHNSVGTIPSESFTILGGEVSTTSTTSTTPEPGSVMLLGSGILGLAGAIRRKLF